MRTRTEKWRFYDLDVWGNAEEGYEVNASYRTLHTIELPKDATPKEILQCLRDNRDIKKGLRRKLIEIDGDEDTIYISYKGRPEIELHREREGKW